MSSEKTLTGRLLKFTRDKKSLLPAQERAALSDAPLALVSAGAGTGKTYTLSWRFLRTLLKDGIQPKDILTLTFTEKAAAEMADRIASRFRDMMPVLDPDGTLLKATEEELSEAPISTIHSFAMSILRQEALFLPAGLAARAMASPEERQFIDRATGALEAFDLEWFKNSLPRELTPETIMGDCLEDLSSVLNAYSPAAAIEFALSLASTLESRDVSPDELIEWANDEDFFIPIAEKIKAACLPQARQVARLWLGRVIPGLLGELPGTGQFRERLEAFMGRWAGVRPEDLDDDGAIEFALSLYDQILGNLRGATGGAAKAAAALADAPDGKLSTHREQFSSLWEGLTFLKAGGEPCYFRLREVLLRFAAMVWHSFLEYRRRRGVISFDDMIRLTKEASSLARAGGRGRTFREIMVDEYQDTNPLQNDFIMALADRESRIFLVGDLKQSIYGFRHADPTLFGSLINNRSLGGEYIPLQANFRSHPKLLAFINTMFARVWSEGLSPSLPHPYEDLEFPGDEERAKKWGQSPISHLETVFRTPGETDGKKESAAQSRLRVARGLAAKFAAFRGLDIWDKNLGEGGGLRKAEWKDMVILVPYRTAFPSIEKVFRSEAGIPVAFEKSRDYFTRGEIEDFTSAVRAIVFPGDRGALPGYLCSPFSGLSVAEGLALMPDCRDFGSRHPKAAARLEELRAIARSSGLYAALCAMLRDQSFLKFYPEWNRRTVLANLRQALDLVREYEEVFGPDGPGCARYLASAGSAAGAVTAASPLGEDEDVVRVMTVHSAKGLEFPIVAVMELDSKPGGRGGQSASLKPSNHLGVGVSSYPPDWLGPEEKGESDTGRLASFLDRADRGEEWERLFYVACTRAMNCLVLCSSCPEDDAGELKIEPGSWLSMLEEELIKDGLSTAPSDGKEEYLERQAPPAEEEKVEAGAAVLAMPSVSDLRYERLSATSYALFTWCPAAWRMKFRQGVEMTWELPSSEEHGGSDLGSLAHWVLARWDFTPETLDRYLGSDMPPRLPPGLRPSWNDRGERKALRGWLEATARGEAGKILAEWAAAGILSREVPFRVAMKDGPLLTGSMDALWRDGDRVFIRDYKITAGDGSNAAEEPSWKALYDSQLLFYGFAARAAFRDAEADIRLIMLRTGEEGKPVTPPESWKEVGESIRETARLAAHGPFEARTDRCGGCFYRSDCPFRGL
ncbi:MAG: UvrD-helicase domain-containing protein [Aminivibrio sp.]|jgi:ATP-dependent helicase/nuclease subunit A